MVKFVALYKTPQDREEFEKHYFDVHVPLVAKIPGLIKTEITRLSGFPGMDSKFFLMAEMYFETMDKLNEGMASIEGRAAGKDLIGFAKDYVVLMNGEVI
jgi:uncharacterized protein (TIGR02118 family)